VTLHVDPVAAWRAAARDPVVAGRLESIYADIASEVAARGPSCWASGRCCNFERTGHRLYVTGLEAAYAVAHLDPAKGHPPLTSLTLAHALSRGGCPFQVLNLCGIHSIKPLGCRVYFCDRSAQNWQRELSERMLQSMKVLHDELNIPYRYGEWRELLAMCC
jgi:Fe-S-cluster containining protein